MAPASAAKALGAFVCQSCRQSALLPRTLAPRRPQRAFSSRPAALSGMTPITIRNAQDRARASPPRQTLTDLLDSTGTTVPELSHTGAMIEPEVKGPHRLHIYSTKHNTHITFVQHPKLASQTASSSITETSQRAEDRKKTIDVLLSLSTGNIGFTKSGRGSYDAAYQLAAYTMKTIVERGMLADMEELHVVLRGFGAGREAVTKALLGTEGRQLRPYIKAVMDATRIKHGGARSKKPRRLG